MRLSKFAVLGSLLLATTAVPVWGAPNATIGSVNYVEGQVSVNGETVDEHNVGNVILGAGQTMVTDQGRAEVLLTPGVFLRLDDNSAVEMISPNLTNTQIGLQRGRAMVEVAYIQPENNIRVEVNGASVQLEKRGLYEFDAAQNDIRVFKGEARVLEEGKNTQLKEGHELVLSGNLKSHSFELAAVQDDFYNWNSLRAGYLAEANIDAAPMYVVGGGWYGPGWWGPGWLGLGWYWNPYFGCYTWIPGNGIWYSPFGFGFYAPIYAYYHGPFFAGGHYYHAFGPGFRPVVPQAGFRPPVHGFNGLSAGHGFRSGFSGAFHGGSFHGGGGHGGGGHGR
jgi:uncharacterized membrane protein YgcG